MNRNRKIRMGWYCAFLVMVLYASPLMRCIREMQPVLYVRGESAQSVQMEELQPWENIVEAAAVETEESALQEVTGAQSLWGGVQTGRQKWQIRLLGIPVKTVDVIYEEEKRLLAGGECIAITLQTRGVLIVGCTQMTDDKGHSIYPASDAGLRPGDVITSLNGYPISSAQALSEQMMNFAGGTVTVGYNRQGEAGKAVLAPVRDPQDGCYRLGLWVRDAMNGIGTLSYMDPVSGRFGALGHGITDQDTGSLLELKEGTVGMAEHVQIEASHAGAPGELKGSSAGEAGYLGTLEENTRFGIFGTVENRMLLEETGSFPVTAAHKEEVKTGEATILCTLDDGRIEEYGIRILRLTRQNTLQTKGILLEVTDSRLLEKTGGIIQGMSGSPILQDGKIIGAVTHVLVNNPVRGYGIFIEDMLEAAK